MLVGERRNGNLLVQLDAKLQAQPVELLRQRWSPDGHSEYLIRWAVQNTEEVAGNSGSTSQAESKSSSILMWMSAEEVYTNCPTLLGKRKPEAPGMAEEKASGSPDEGALQEMTEDVRTLVQRAARQMSQSSGPDSSILNTIHVLSAYASIGSLAGVFKETGALDLLMKMLCNPEKQIRKNAGKMLRALASHDAGSRAHVLLSLSQQDGIEQHMDFESRYTLLQLFAETTSSEEHCISFEGIHLPQIPGKQLFSLVKRYLCVTSLLDQLSSDRPERTERPRLQRQFDFSMAMGSLICELVRAMGWVSEDAPETGKSQDKEPPPRVLRSIFQPKVAPRASFPVVMGPPVPAIATKKKPAKTFLEPSDFASRNAYVDYVQEALKPGMSVRMLEDYDEISAGDEGVFRQSNNGMPPVQVHWRSTGRTYWVHWHMVQIIGEQAEEDGAEKASCTADSVSVSPAAQTLQSRPCSSMYALPYLGLASSKESKLLRQDEWWEVLFFIRRLEAREQQEVQEMIRHSLEQEVCGEGEQALIQAFVSVDQVQKILAFLSKHFQGRALRDLQNSHVYAKYILGSDDAEKPTCASGSSLQDDALPGGLLSKKPKSEEPKKADKEESLSNAEPSVLQVLHNLLSQEGLQVSAPTEEKSKGSGSPWGSSAGICLELLAEMLDKVKRNVCGVEALTFIVPIVEQQLGEEVHSAKVEGRPSCREKIVKLLVELLTSQVKEKLLVVTCLQLTYLVMSKYDWRVLFATEGGVRAVLACMQEHQSSAAVQHIGLAVLKVLTGVGSPGHDALCSGDAQVMREIGTSMGTSTSLLGTIPRAVITLLSVEGCLSGVYNGLLLIRTLAKNHEAMSEQMSTMELPAALRSFLKNSQNSITEPEHRALSLLVANVLSELVTGAESAPVLAVEEMDLMTLLSSLKDSQMSRSILPALERCVCGSLSAGRWDAPQLLTHPVFFLRLLSCLEQLRSERRLQLCIYRLRSVTLMSSGSVGREHTSRSWTCSCGVWLEHAPGQNRSQTSVGRRLPSPPIPSKPAN